MELAVETGGLTRDFGSFRAVDGIGLAVPAGSFYGFLGPNGAGKSTTIKCLTGLLEPSGGTIRILGIDLQSFVARGGTIFLTSHILEIVERLSTHIGVIANGRLVAQGPIDELRSGGAAGASLEELFIRLVGGEAQVTSSLDWI